MSTVYFTALFLALLAKSQRAYVMVGCLSSVRRKQFWFCNDNKQIWSDLFQTLEIGRSLGNTGQVRIWAKSVNRNWVICPRISSIFPIFEAFQRLLEQIYSDLFQTLEIGRSLWNTGHLGYLPLNFPHFRGFATITRANFIQSVSNFGNRNLSFLILLIRCP